MKGKDEIEVTGEVGKSILLRIIGGKGKDIISDHAVVKDATAAVTEELGDGYSAALINYGFMANAVWTTEEAAAAMNESS